MLEMMAPRITDINGILSPVISDSLIGIIIVGIGFLGCAFIWWIRSVLRHRLPQPFLGDGSNVEWAEQKRAEIAAGGIAYDPIIVGDAVQTNFEVAGRDSEKQSKDSAIGGNGNHSEKKSFKGSNSSNADVLLRSWLSNSGHTDDGWAEKLLGDREQT